MIETYEEYVKRKKKEIEERNKREYEKRAVNVSDIKTFNKKELAPIKQTATQQTKTPKKTTDNRTWFSSGALKDGYDFGDITKTLLGTSKDITENLYTGVIGIGEKTIDAGAYALGGIAGVFGNDKVKNNMQDFIKKDLIDEEKLGKYASWTSPTSAINFILNGTKTDENSFLGEKSDSLVQSAGQLGGTIGLQAVGVPWWLTTGVTGFGGEVEQAFNQDATYGEAGISGLITAGAEILTEKISGGIKFGGKTLDEGLQKIISEKITNKFIQKTTKLGIDAVGEGFEEVLSELLSNVGKKLSYEDEKTWEEILTSEEAMDSYIESFIGGAVLGGAGSVTQSIMASKQQAVQQAEQELGRTLTTEERTQIEEAVERQQENASNTEVQEDIAPIKEQDTLPKSKVVDKDGNPLKVYHGTRADFDTFDTSKAGQNYQNNWSNNGKGIYFTDDKAEAMEFAKSSIDNGDPKVKEAYLDITNPFDSSKDYTNELSDMAKEYGIEPYYLERGDRLFNWFNSNNKDIVGALKKYGYDGIVDHGHYTVFDSNQIKSVDNTLEKQLENNLDQAVKNEKAMVDYFESYLADENITNPTEQDIHDSFGVYEQMDADVDGYQEAEGKYYETIKKYLKNKENAQKTENTVQNIAPIKEVNPNKDLKRTNFKYTPKETDSNFRKTVYESASKVMNDTEASHKLADVVAKIAEDKQTTYRFTNNKELKKQGLDFKGLTINGLVNENGEVLINVDSEKALNTILGHETTHLLEGTKEYQALKQVAIEYAKTTGEYQARLDKITKLYKDKNVDIEAELTSDIVGEYLFTNEKFVNELSVQQPTVFKKIKDLIDDLVVRFTGTKEEKALREVQKRFKEAYRNNATDTNVATNETQYSVSDYQEYTNELNATLEKAKKVDEQFYNDLKSQQEEYIERHQLEYDILKETNSRPATNENINDNFFKEHRSEYDEKRGIKTADGKLTVMHLQKGDNLAKLSFTEGEDKIWIDELYVKNQRQGYGSDIVNAIQKYANENGKYVEAFKELSTAKGFWDKTLRSDTKYSLTDNQGRTLTKEQQEFFKDSKVRDENGNLLEVYHGSNSEHTIFKNPEKTFYDYSSGEKFKNTSITFFTDSLEVADTYVDKEQNPNKKPMTVYLNITNPLVIDAQYNYSRYLPEFVTGGKPSDVNTIVEEAYKSGKYDGVIIKRVGDVGLYGEYDLTDGRQYATDYVIFNSNQAKNVDNKKPTSDPDIRYSLDEDIAPIDEDIIPENNEQKTITKEWTDKVNKQNEVNEPLAKEQAKATGHNTMIGYSPILSNYKLYSKGSLSWVTPDGKVNSKVIAETEIDSFLSKNKIDRLVGGINAFENGLSNQLTTKEDIAPIKQELADLTSELKETIKDTKKELKTLTSEINEVKTAVEEAKAFTEAEASENLRTAMVEDILPTEEEYNANATFEFSSELPEIKPKNDIVNNIKNTFGIKLYEARELYNTISRKESVDEVYEALEDYREVTLKEDSGDYKELKNRIRHTKIDMSNLKNEITDYNDFRKSNFGKLRLGNDGQALDVLYQELSEQYPAEFPSEITNPADQLEHLVDFMNKDTSSHWTFSFTDSDLYGLAEQLYVEIGNKERYEVNRKSAWFLGRELKGMKDPESVYGPIASNPNKVQEIAPIKEQVQEVAPIKEQTQDIAPTFKEVANESEDPLFKAIENQEKRRGAKAEERKAKQQVKLEADDYNDNHNVIPKKKTLKETASKTWDAFQSHFVNRNRQIDNLSKASGNSEIKFKGDRVNNIAGEVGGDIFTAQTDNYGNVIGKSLDAPFQQARESGLDNYFDNYLKHQSNIERHERGKGSAKVSAKVSQDYVNAYESKYPQFKEWAQDVYKYNQNLLNNAVQNGLIDSNFKDMLTSMYGKYVPFYGDTKATEPSLYMTPDEIKASRPIKRAKGGSSANLLGIEQAMIQQTYAYKNAIAKNDLYKEIGKVIDQKVELGADVRNSATDMQSTLYADENGKYLTYYENGQQKTVQINDELYTELSRDLENQIRNLEEKYSLITKPLQKISQLRGQILTTYNVGFVATNPFKDIQDALLNTKQFKGYLKNVLTQSTIKDSVRGKNVNQYAEQFKALTGKDITSVQDASSLKGKAKALYNDYQAGTMWNRFITSYGTNATSMEFGEAGVDVKAKNKGFLNSIEKANNYMEVMFRYPEFKATLESGKSFTEALYNAREVTTNFGRGGTISKAINRNGATFFNTSVQGMDKFFRNFSGENGARGFVGAVSKAVMLGMVPALLNDLLFGFGDDQDEEYEALPDYIKDNYYLFKTSEGNFIRIPKGRMISVLGSSARRTLEMASGEEKAFEGYLKNASDQIGASNPLKENVFSPLIQAYGSENGEAWYGGDLVPTRLQNKPKAEQYDEGTDEFSKWLGEQLNISPYKLNYVIDQYSGGFGDLILPMITKEANSNGTLLAPLKDKFTVNSTDDNKYVGELYDLSEELTIKANGENATQEDKLKNKYLNSIKSQMSELYKEKREIQNSDFSKEAKYAQVQMIQNMINALAKEGLDFYTEIEVTDNYANVGYYEDYYKTSEGEWYSVNDDEIEDLDLMGMTAEEKNSYFGAKNKIYTIKDKYGDSEDEDKYTAQKREIIDEIRNANLTDEAKSYLYDKYYASTDKLNVITETSIPFDVYLDLEYQDFKADKNKYGNSISGSKKAKIVNYIESTGLDYNQKIILHKMYYPADDDYNYDVVDYIVNNVETYETRINILETLGFKIAEDGTIYWD